MICPPLILPDAEHVTMALAPGRIVDLGDDALQGLVLLVGYFAYMGWLVSQGATA